MGVLTCFYNLVEPVRYMQCRRCLVRFKVLHLMLLEGRFSCAVLVALLYGHACGLSLFETCTFEALRT